MPARLRYLNNGEIAVKKNSSYKDGLVSVSWANGGNHKVPLQRSFAESFVFV